MGQSERYGQANRSVKSLLAVLSGKMRFNILVALCDGSVTVGTLQERLGADLGYVSRTLRELNCVGLVECGLVGKRHIYYLGSGVDVERRGELIEVSLHTSDGGRIAIDTHRDAWSEDRGGVCDGGDQSDVRRSGGETAA